MLGSLALGGDDFPARQGCYRPRSSGILYPRRLGRLPPLDRDARTCTTEPEETKHPILQRRRLVAERSSVRGWQDSRAVHDSRGLYSERAPSWQDLREVRSRKAICGAFRMHSAHILPKPAHFGYTAAICCHELAIFPSEATFGMHGVKNLPRIAARERISRAFCHRQAPRERISATSCQQNGIFVRAGLLPCHNSRTA